MWLNLLWGRTKEEAEIMLQATIWVTWGLNLVYYGKIEPWCIWVLMLKLYSLGRHILELFRNHLVRVNIGILTFSLMEINVARLTTGSSVCVCVRLRACACVCLCVCLCFQSFVFRTTWQIITNKTDKNVMLSEYTYSHFLILHSKC
jgi:hypothetical protein